MTFDKRPSGKWRCRILIDGKQKSFSADTKKEAEQKAIAYSLQYKLESKQNKVELTLEEACEQYLQGRENVISPTTLNSYNLYTKNHYQDLMKSKLGDITVQQVQEQITKMKSKGLGRKTIVNVTTFYISVLKYYDYTINRDRLKFPAKVKVKYATPDPTNIALIIKATKDTEIEIPVLLALWLSLRMGEILGLKWDKVNKDTITIDNTLVYIGGIVYEKPPKTEESTRTLPMPRYIWERLKKAPKNSDFVVPMTSIHLREQFHKILKENNIPDCRFHDLRHANASVMLGVLQIDQKTAQKRGGWSSPIVMENAYHQVFSQQEIAAANAIDSFFENIVN